MTAKFYLSPLPTNEEIDFLNECRFAGKEGFQGLSPWELEENFLKLLGSNTEAIEWLRFTVRQLPRIEFVGIEEFDGKYLTVDNCNVIYSDSPPDRDFLKSVRMARILLEMDCDPQVIAFLLDLRGAAPAHVRYMAGPIAVYPSQWNISIPKWMFKAVWIDRFDAIVAEHSTGTVGELASHSEVLMHMYSPSLMFPLDTHNAKMYEWAWSQTMNKHKPEKGRTCWESAGLEPAPRSRWSRYDKSEYDNLARQLRTKVVNVARQRGVASKRKN